MRARPEQARVVHEQVDPVAGRRRPARAGAPGSATSPAIAVTRSRPRGGLGERVGAARVHHQVPAAPSERASEREPEPARGSGDDSNRHAPHDAPSSALEVKVEKRGGADPANQLGRASASRARTAGRRASRRRLRPAPGGAAGAAPAPACAPAPARAPAARARPAPRRRRPPPRTCRRAGR